MNNSRVLEVVATVPSGPVAPGTNFSFYLHRGGNPDDVPDSGFQWLVFHNGRALSAATLSTLCVGFIPHTFNRSNFGFRLKPEVRGLIEVRGFGHNLEGRWAYPIRRAEPEGPLTKSDLDAVADRIVQEVKGLVQGLVK